MRRGVLWDSSAILALLDADDADHQQAVTTAFEIAGEKRRSFITNYIEVETHALLLKKLGRLIAREWLLSANLPILRVQRAEEELARELLARYRDKNWSLCDAISFAVMEKREVGSAFSFDRHFVQRGRFAVLGPASGYLHDGE